MNRKRAILTALLSVLALCILYAYVATPRLEKAPPRTATQRVRPDAKVTGDLKSKSVQARINFDFLAVEPQDFAAAKRDIFRFGEKSPIRTETPVVRVGSPEPPVAAVVEMLEEPIVPFAVVQQSLSKFTFLGFLEKAGEKTVFLSSRGDLFLVKRGESFGADQEFLVDAIDGNILKVKHVGREGLVEIPLIEQQKLNASASAPVHIAPMAGAPSQPTPRTFTPKRRMLRPAAPQENEEPFTEMNEENDPEEEQEAEEPAEGDALEEEANGSNQ